MGQIVSMQMPIFFDSGLIAIVLLRSFYAVNEYKYVFDKIFVQHVICSCIVIQ